MKKTLLLKEKPILRFIEFDSKWEKCDLNSFTKIYDGTHQTPKYVDDGIPFYSVEHVTANNFSKTKYISEKVYCREIEKVKLEKNDILMTRIGDIGTTKLINWDVKASFYVSLALIKNSEKIKSNFLNQILQTNSFQKELYKRTIHVAFPRKINLGEIGKCLICFPNDKKEQQKIASFLTAVDNKINALRRKHELLTEYKRGVMQKIFSQEIRFTEFIDEIQIKTLKDVSSQYYQGINTTADKVRYFQQGKPILQAKHITDEVIKFDDARYVSESNFQKYSSKYSPLSGDILISNIGTLGKIVMVTRETDFLIAWNIFRIQLNKEIVIPGYILQYLRYVSSKGYFERVKTGNATKFVNKSDVMRIKVLLPSIDEQKKISDFLNSIEIKISLLLNQIEKMETFKKGLLQQMFV